MVPEYITRLREMTEEQRQAMWAFAITPQRKAMMYEYLAREVMGDEAYEEFVREIKKRTQAALSACEG